MLFSGSAGRVGPEEFSRPKRDSARRWRMRSGGLCVAGQAIVATWPLLSNRGQTPGARRNSLVRSAPASTQTVDAAGRSLGAAAVAHAVSVDRRGQGSRGRVHIRSQGRQGNHRKNSNQLLHDLLLRFALPHCRAPGERAIRVPAQPAAPSPTHPAPPRKPK